MPSKVIALAGEAGTGKDTFAKPLIERGFIHESFAKNLKDMCIEIFNLTPALVNTQQGKARRLDVPRRLTFQNLVRISQWMSKTHSLAECTPKIDNIKNVYIDSFVKSIGKAKEFKTPREILQFVGTDICRELIPTYHVDVLAHNLAKYPGPVVITDARFPNERELLKTKFDAQLIRLKRPSYTPSDQFVTLEPTPDQKKPVLVAGAHASETSLGTDEEYDVIIINDGTVQDLQEKALTFL